MREPAMHHIPALEEDEDECEFELFRVRLVFRAAAG